MSTSGQVDNLIAGAIEGAESLLATTTNLAGEKTPERARRLLNQAQAFTHGAERLVRALVEISTKAEGGN